VTSDPGMTPLGGRRRDAAIRTAEAPPWAGEARRGVLGPAPSRRVTAPERCLGVRSAATAAPPYGSGAGATIFI